MGLDRNLVRPLGILIRNSTPMRWGPKLVPRGEMLIGRYQQPDLHLSQREESDVRREENNRFGYFKVLYFSHNVERSYSHTILLKTFKYSQTHMYTHIRGSAETFLTLPTSQNSYFVTVSRKIFVFLVKVEICGIVSIIFQFFSDYWLKKVNGNLNILKGVQNLV